jgi:4-diphosphocytidyl-2-C-methyl-D-erythritol kinase
MDLLRETAPAKINLTLKVLGRRSDGFHELSSLIAFASIGDTLQLEPYDELSLAVSGEFSANLDEDNLVLQAVRLLTERCGEVKTGAFALEKNLPVAAGLGGGSADAAAVLRLISRVNPAVVTPQIMEQTACQLGSDVLACLMSHAAIMRGRGEKLFPLEQLPVLDIVLVNPGIPLAAGDVYAALEAPLFEDDFKPGDTGEMSFASIADVLKHISNFGNDLQQPAIKLAPEIGDVLSALSHTEGCEVAQMSGSGSTCFGVFANAGHAASARDRLRAAHPDWWVVSTRLE